MRVPLTAAPRCSSAPTASLGIRSRGDAAAEAARLDLAVKAFGARTLFEGDGGAESPSAPPNGGVFAIKNGTGTLIPGSPQFVAGLAWHGGALYVSGGSVTGPTSAKWQILKWSGWNGTTFTKRLAIYTAPKGFPGFNGITFGPDGRLYVGVDVGLLNGNDHGPAKTPYVYVILSMKPNGKGFKLRRRSGWACTAARSTWAN